MIKWGRRKKQQPPSSPRPSLLSSWLVRLKKMGGGTANANANANAGGHYKDVVVAGKHHNPTPPPVKAACYKSRSTNHHNSPSTAQQEELYRGDEAFWRLSFRKEKVYETEEDDEKREAFTKMVSGIRRMKELQKITTSERVKAREFNTSTPRMKILIKSSSPSSRRRIRRRRRKNHVKEEEEDEYVFSAGGGLCDSGDYVNRGSPIPKRRGIRCRVVGHSISSERKGGGLERFAVVKCSLDPERDFRESMVEMILERNICGPQQLQDLLASYLALNSHHYHHLIINVFRQICFHFNI